MNDFTHLNAAGEVHMVGVTGKAVTVRQASAEAFVRCTAEVLDRLRSGDLPKGDVLALARIAGIAAAKRTPELLPLAHVIGLHAAEVEVQVQAEVIRIEARVGAADRTGVEMEALTAATISALAVVDMVKGLDRSVTIERVRLLSKDGGRSGAWRADQ